MNKYQFINVYHVYPIKKIKKSEFLAWPPRRGVQRPTGLVGAGLDSFGLDSVLFDHIHASFLARRQAGMAAP